MKKMICLSLAVCMLFVFSACTQDMTEPTQKDQYTTSLETTAPVENTIADTATAQSIETTVPETTAEPTTVPTTVPETNAPETVHQHSYVPEKVDATCTEDGYTVYTCACGDSYQGDMVKALGHEYKSKTVEPTETTQGYTKHTCVHCGDSYKDNYTDPIGTVPVETTPPVETTIPAETKPAHTHQYTGKVTKPTCESGGFTTYTCSCGESYTADKTDPTGHSYKDTVVEPTETDQGYTIHECTNCGDSYKDSYTDPVPPETTTPASTELKASDIEDAILKYINQFRGSSLTRLSGMSKVAKERSRQILYAGHFDHIGEDIKAAHNKYQYGEYQDVTWIGLDASESYYWSDSMEAIAYRGQGGWIENADQMGKEIAEQIRDSAGHWSYIGSSEYSYCGIGVSEYDGKWYVCIMVNDINYG